MLTELALILCLQLGALLFAGAVARSTLKSPQGSGDVRRLAGAATRALEAFLWRETKLVAATIGIATAVLLAGHAYLVASGAPNADLRRAAWTIVAVMAGSGCCCVVGYAATELPVRIAGRAAGAARTGLEQALALSLRVGGVVGLFADALSVLGCAGLFGLLYLLAGGTAIDAAELPSVLKGAVVVLPGFGFGAVVAALVLGFTGAAYQASARAGGRIGSERGAGLERGDRRNPAMVAEFVGDHVGLAAYRAIDMFVCSTVGNIVAWIVGVGLFLKAGESATWGLLTLPAVVRALGVVASGFGVMAAHSDREESPSRALWRGQAVTSVLMLASVAGAGLWLLGSPWPYLLGAAAVGLGLIALVTHVVRWTVQSSSAPVREVVEAARAGEAVATGRGFAQGLVAAGPPLLALGVALPTIWWLGRETQIANGELLALSTALSAVLGGGSYMLALNLVAPVTAAALGVFGLDDDDASNEARRRIHWLDDAAAGSATVAQSFFILVGCSAALLAGHTLPVIATISSSASLVPLPVVVASGLIGAAVVLAFAGATLGHSARSARAGVLEVERQLRAFIRAGGGGVIPSDYTPSYRTMVDQASRHAATSVVRPVLLALLVPAALGFGLRLLYRSQALAMEGLMSYVAIATATGLGLALAAEGARGVLTAAYRANRPRGSSTGFEASVTANALGDLVGGSAGPAAHLLVKASAITALIVAPLIS